MDGLQLIWNSDVFISGGGTMNREAGLLAGGNREKGVGVVECGSKDVVEFGSDGLAESGSSREEQNNDLNEQSDSAVSGPSPAASRQPPVTSTPASPAVYSIFTGRKPYLDEYLAEQGRLVFIDQLEKVDLIEIKSRRQRSEDGGQKTENSDQRLEFVPKNPELVKEVVEILLKLETGNVKRQA